MAAGSPGTFAINAFPQVMLFQEMAVLLFSSCMVSGLSPDQLREVHKKCSQVAAPRVPNAARTASPRSNS